MTISGFTFLKNAHKLYYPVEESILSILNLVDEFVVVIGKGDTDDTTKQLILNLNSPKIKIIDSVWDTNIYKNASIYAQQTDLAKSHCKGDWLFYLQGDEVIHEDDITEIKNACSSYQFNSKIEGFVFNYLHFWGSYKHYFANHCWYKKEIRIIRNLPQIHSWRDAQSFRYFEEFDGINYFQKEKSRKLNCKLLTARVFHYGWVRPPIVMKNKMDAVKLNYNANLWKDFDHIFDYGRVDYCKIFKSTHPKIMQNRISTHNWLHQLRFSGPVVINRTKLKHERTKYRLLSWFEENLLGGFVIGGFKNYKII